MEGLEKKDAGSDDALWQVEMAKQRGLQTTKGVNFLNLSKEARTYGNDKLALSMLSRARDILFNDYLSSIMQEVEGHSETVKMNRLEEAIKRSKTAFSSGRTREAYQIILDSMKDEEKTAESAQKEAFEDPDLYSEALGDLQKVWLKMKHEEGKGKDISKANKMMKQAKTLLSKRNYGRVIEICDEITREIQTPQERLTEEADQNIDDITKTLKALFPNDPRSPKERFFKRQIEELIAQARSSLKAGSVIDGINYSKKAREILTRLEQETIKGEIPRQIIELRASLDELRRFNIDVSYEDFLLKQVEETFWNGHFIESRKTANKLLNILNNARINYRMNELNTKYRSLNDRLKEMVGREGYLEAKEYLEKARSLMDQKAFDMAVSFLDKAHHVLEP
ncbi:MAG: hypothetical protein QCI82_03630 [Candidatus Thermoplasmatota archaeon]|nr:hypothetical protein [Candidatus Thermoplasmatota archaeon]